MPRSKGGTVARKAHKKVIKKAAGYFNRRKNIFRVAVQAVEKAQQYQYRDRRTKKRNFRALTEHGNCASWCAGREDRKSTRLNSSHTVISYAVFCLKKKKH